MRQLLSLMGAVLLLASCQSVSPRVAPSPSPEGQPLLLGAKYSVHSAVLEEDRDIHLYLPPGYQTSSERYPVLYLLDGDDHFHHSTGIVQFLAGNFHIPPMIVVGVSTRKNRVRDLTPPPRGDLQMSRDPAAGTYAQAYPTAGGADRFLRFLETELAPHLEAKYRTQPYRILVGHSLGGLFALHVLTNRPESFQAYIAISPSLWWNEGELVAGAVKSLERLPRQERFLYMSMGKEGDHMLQPIQRLAESLEQAKPARLAWRYAYLANDHHGSTPHRTLYDGLEALFDDLRVAQALAFEGELAQVEEHHARLSKRLGYEVQPSEDLVNVMGYALLRKGNVEGALAAFRRNVERHGNSANVHDSLGEALEAAGQLDAAVESYKRALTLGARAGDVHPAWQEHLERALVKLAAAPESPVVPARTSGDSTP